MPVSPRSRSAGRLANDRLILDSAVSEALATGLDGVGLGSVARRADVTTGAMYSRYADARDLLASMWVERLAAPTRELLVECTRAILEQPKAPGVDIVRRISRMSKEQRVGLEALAVAHRVPELEDVMIDDVTDLLAELGISTHGDASDLGKLRAILSLSTVLACAMNRQWETDIAEWSMIVDFYWVTMKLMKSAPGVPTTGEVGPVLVTTESPLRDVLVRSAADVVARSGVASATVARIARRARMSSGAIYTLYETKEELLLDAMERMLESASSDVSLVVEDGASRGAVADATTSVFGLAFAPERLQWRRFRLETYVAARTNRKVAAVVKRIQRESLVRYRRLYEPQGMSDETIRLLARSGQNHPIAFSLLELHVADMAKMDVRPFSAAMLEAQKLLGR